MENVRVKVQYLDHLLKQLIRYKKYKIKHLRDDIPAIQKKLLSELESIFLELKEEISKDSISEFGEVEWMIFSSGNWRRKRVYRYQFGYDWKLQRQLRKFEIIKNKIVKEWRGKIPDCLKSESDKSLYSSQSSVKSSFGIKYLPYEMEQLPESPVKRVRFMVLDQEQEDLKKWQADLKKEQEDLEVAVDILEDMGEIQHDIENQLVKGHYKLLEANREAESAAQESSRALEEVKEMAGSRWSWLPMKIGAAFGFIGAVGGGIFGNLPGAAIGSASGSVGGAAAGALVKKAIKNKVKRHRSELPIYLDESNL